MLTFLHAADFHLDSPFAALAPEQAAARRAEQRLLLDRLCDLAAERHADLALFAGDLFDGETVYPETVETLSGRLGEMKIPVFIAPGNHDFYSPRSPYARAVWPENVHIFRHETPEAVALPDLEITVHGAAFTAPKCTRSLLAGFRAPSDGREHLMVLHGAVGEADGQYDPVTKEEIAQSGLAYLALGHVHLRAAAEKAGETVYAWPGCPEGRGFDETGARGVYVGTLERGGVKLEFVPLALRRYEILRVDVTDREPEAAVRAAMPADAAKHIFRVILTGETDFAPDLAALSGALSGACYRLQMRDATRLRRDVWARAGEDTLTGLFLRNLRARYEEAESEDARAAVTLAVRMGLSALEGREERL
ncbi:MAG TPA: DNA repair exonuclease [Oscillospiraceae bacterium]|nr:DNA repair exonuclease [Oscillospiraceae bacterium]